MEVCTKEGMIMRIVKFNTGDKEEKLFKLLKIANLNQLNESAVRIMIKRVEKFLLKQERYEHLILLREIEKEYNLNFYFKTDVE